MTKYTKDILNEREKTHGDFGEVSEIAQSIKQLARTAPSWDMMTSCQQEAVDMIAGKMARIVCGNPYEEDHWVDISGYADLSVNLTRDQRKK